MKKITNTFITVYLLFQFVGCQHSYERTEINNEYKNLDSTFIQELIPKNVLFYEGAFLTHYEKMEIDFLLFLNKFVLFELDYFLTSFQEKMYVSRLFSKENSSVFIKNYKKYESENEYEEIHKYTFNNNKKIIEISNMGDSFLTIKFSYNTNNQISTIEIPNYSIPLIQKDNHNIKHIPTRKYTNQMIYKYQDLKLISETTSNSSNKYIEIDEQRILLTDPVKNFFRSATNNSPISYIKINVKESFLGHQYIVGLKNELPIFIAQFSEDLIGKTFSDFPYQLILFSRNNSYITSKHYTENPLTKNLDLRMVHKIKRSSDYKLEAIKEISRFVNQEPTHVNDYHFEYHYSNNELLGFNIFKREYNYDLEPSEIDEIDYELEEYFHKIK